MGLDEFTLLYVPFSIKIKYAKPSIIWNRWKRQWWSSCNSGSSSFILRCCFAATALWGRGCDVGGTGVVESAGTATCCCGSSGSRNRGSLAASGSSHSRFSSCQGSRSRCCVPSNNFTVWITPSSDGKVSTTQAKGQACWCFSLENSTISPSFGW